MFKKKLKFQILFMVLFVLLIGMLTLYYISANEIRKTIDKKQLNFYTEKVDTILQSLDNRYQKLLRTNLVESYEYSFKEFSINELRKVHYAKTMKVYPFIINEERLLALHPTYNVENPEAYVNSKVYQKIVKAEQGDFNVVVQGVDKWVILKRYKNWDWIVGYSMPLSVKYEALTDFRNKFLVLTLLIVTIISLCIILIVRHVLSPIERLIAASKNISDGDLESEIQINGSYELTQLSHGFSIMKDKIKQNIDELEDKVEVRTIELTRSNDELAQKIVVLKETQDKLVESEKMASLGGLVAGVAHEINTPVGISLTVVTHFLKINEDLGRKFEDNKLSAKDLKMFLQQSNDCAEQLNKNIERTAHLINSFKQVAVDQTSEDVRLFELTSYLKEVIFSLDGVVKKNNVVVDVTSDEEINLKSSPGAYAQVFTNLILNSTIHGFGGGNEPHNGIERKITIDISREDKYINILYKDNGKGIEESNLGQIFEPFFTTNRNQGGTGLGLNIVYNTITSKLRGTISCSSELDKGVAFAIKVPIKFDDSTVH
ncbi:ATP-binding protein [Vibrio tapetis subsp. quintayensis]|uniref:HAMP domain-containing sensor histidine kinase n=1 Tax=Vibrio tapetis TaxID=52443 RepID=UPI0025B5E4B7|nr:ATP-binding protein [Vibrio tapetis]MDN3682972.1 ATP-binding protein [Vibrio tapetis subsp. quintayensis]